MSRPDLQINTDNEYDDQDQNDDQRDDDEIYTDEESVRSSFPSALELCCNPIDADRSTHALSIGLCLDRLGHRLWTELRTVSPTSRLLSFGLPASLGISSRWVFC
jgi:hypothetical protein